MLMWSRTLQHIGQHLGPVTDIMVLLVRIRLTEVVVETFKSHKWPHTSSDTFLLRERMTLFHQPTYSVSYYTPNVPPHHIEG